MIENALTRQHTAGQCEIWPALWNSGQGPVVVPSDPGSPKSVVGNTNEPLGGEFQMDPLIFAWGLAFVAALWFVPIETPSV